MYCSTCGSAVAHGLSYCKHCGEKLGGAKGDALDKASEVKPEMLVRAMVMVFIFGLGAITVLMSVMRRLPDFDFGPDASDCPSNRGTGHRDEHGNGCIPRQNANGSATRRGTEVSPVDLAPRYHSRAVSAARRRAAATM